MTNVWRHKNPSGGNRDGVGFAINQVKNFLEANGLDRALRARCVAAAAANAAG